MLLANTKPADLSLRLYEKGLAPRFVKMCTLVCTKNLSHEASRWIASTSSMATSVGC